MTRRYSKNEGGGGSPKRIRAVCARVALLGVGLIWEGDLMVAIGLVLINLAVVAVSLGISNGNDIEWLAVLLFVGAGVACVCWDIHREDLRLQRNDADCRARCLRKKEAILFVCAFTSWLGGFFASQAFAVKGEGLLFAFGAWAAASIALTVWCRKVAKEFQEVL